MTTAEAAEAAERETRYDRQIRLWGDEAQARLERAHVCVVGSGATGSETLKNLVLPGIGAFTLVDAARLGRCDLGNNFFVPASALPPPSPPLERGQQQPSRAAAVCGAVAELNSRVRAHCVDDADSDDLSAAFFRPFACVVAAQLSDAQVARLAALLRPLRVPLVAVRAYGLVGTLRVCVAPEHCVHDARPDTAPPDLRVGAPWAELQALADGVDLAALDSAQHSHVPFVLLLAKAAADWRAAHEGRLPSVADRSERDAFRRSVRALQRPDAALEELNVAEAVAHAHVVWAAEASGAPPPPVAAVLDDPRCEQPPPCAADDDGDFWLLCGALRGFVRNEGRGLLPLPGAIPDMVAHTDAYVRLQRVYGAKAEADAAAVARRADALAVALRRPRPKPEAVRAFCRSAAHIRVQTCAGMPAAPDAQLPQDVVSAMLTDPSDPLPWLLGISVADAFRAKHGRFPGLFDDQVEADVVALREIAATLLPARGVPAHGLSDDVLHELSRYGAAELHPVAAFLGGVAAQEVIKLITHRFVPLDNTLVFNGITCLTRSYRL